MNSGKQGCNAIGEGLKSQSQSVMTTLSQVSVGPKRERSVTEYAHGVVAMK